MALGIVEQLTHSTVRIECTLHDGNSSCGTGFFMNLLRNEERYIPVIITNKHVIKGARKGRIHFTFQLPSGEPDPGSHQQYEIDHFEQQWIPHPDPAIDLAILPIAQIVENVGTSTGRKCFFIALDTALIPSTDERQGYSAMEDVVMIGYPNGIWDQVNNMPVIRKGITATHVKTKWRGNDEFLTDIASFPGSSGSPVLMVNIGSYVDSNGTTNMGVNRVRLLGVHYAGAQHRADGTIEIVTVPTDTRPVPVTMIPNNIGVVINSLRILDFEALLRRIAR
jgi:hypothetical protein